MIDKTYIINLARRPDKREHMNMQIDKLKTQGININHTFFNGIDGNDSENLSKYKFNIPNWFDPNSGKAMTNGEVGCALSHYLIWCDIVENVKNKNLSENCHVLILEDDIIFIDNFLAKLKLCVAEFDLPYDMLYIHRKPLDLVNEIKISLHINKAKKSYWTCGYILSYPGAKKLANTNYLDNLIPVDEFLPIMYGCNIFGFEKLYDVYEKIECYAVSPNLLKLTDNAFCDSETFHSQSFMKYDKYEFNDKNGIAKSFDVVYIGPCQGHSYHRFVYYCDLYGIPLNAIDNANSSSNLQLLSSKLGSWSNKKLDDTLLLVILVNRFDQCNLLPIASPNEIIAKYYDFAKNDDCIIMMDNNIPNNKEVFCVWGQTLMQLFDNHGTSTDTNSSFAALVPHNEPINYNIIYDSKQQIFQLLDGSSIMFNHKTSRIINSQTKTMPCLFLANTMASIIMLNSIENYTGNNWNEYYGFHVYKKPMTIFPKIYVSLNLKHNKNILNILDKLAYPKEFLTIRINKVSTSQAENMIIHTCENELYQRDIINFLESDCDYYFYINNDCVLTNPNVLMELLDLNKTVIAPMIKRGTEAWSNFWGDLDQRGYYKRSFDYFDIINRKRKGCWNVPYITGIYLIKREIIQAVPNLFTENLNMDIDMRMCHHLRENDIFMYVTNMSEYGYLEDISQPQTTISSNEITLFDILVADKKDAWEKKYLHPLFYQHKNNPERLNFQELCDGIYIFPLFSEYFCTEMIKTAEAYGKWSKGKDEHKDPRIGKDYYENVPTVDVQLFEIKLEKQWQTIVFSYIVPVARVLYHNYKTKDINLAFIVKYNFEDQSSLSPHHDSSTYTVNIALNRGNGIDYDGGGCRFIRQNVVLKNQDPGMCCIHPGRLTAFHEGLPVTAGTRYILVSFIN
jgi:GR25 family glycosyltransferase involved in LPS biosynthesis